MKPISNPPNPWSTTQVEWLEEPPEAKLEVFEEEAKSVLSENDSPDIGFRFSVNPYRGCGHACSYCLVGDTRILMADGDTRPIHALRVGDEVYGTAKGGAWLTYARTRVLAKWSVEKPAYRVRVEDGNELVASGDHRLRTMKGWRHVAGSERGPLRRPHLRVGSDLAQVSSPDDPFPRGNFDGVRLKSQIRTRVAEIEPLDEVMRMYDITTGTGDFIANGVLSHNCYARPSHQYLGFGAGTDFERKIVVKVNAPEALRRELMKPSWKGETIVFSGNTDCYQPLEASYGLTRRCLETCLEFRQPVGLITKGILVRRDVDVLGALARDARASVHLSIPFLDPRVAKGIEPGVAAPARRFEAMRALADAGVSVGISLAPVIPGLNDADIPELLERARDAGATSAFITLVRLPAEVLPVFTERIEAAFPGRAKKVISQILQVRGGRMNDPRFGTRMSGSGPRWKVIRDLFDLHCRRLGLNPDDDGEDEPTTFRRPTDQASLFDA